MAQAVPDILNRLLVIHARSLAVYLADAVPWGRPEDEHARDVLVMIAADQLTTVDRLANAIQEQGGVVLKSEFPMEFTGFNDLSIEYLISELVRYQAADVVEIEELVTQLDSDASSRPLAEETLGAAKGHLETLTELMQHAS